MDFILWPRNDIEKIVCLLFSRWKGADDEPFRPVQVRTCHLSRIFAKNKHLSNLIYPRHLNVPTCTIWLMSLSSDLQAKFEFHHGDYEKQCLHALGRKDKAGMVMNNPSQSVFLFMDRQHLQVSQSNEVVMLLI